MQLSRFPDHFSARFPRLLGQRVLVAVSGGADSVALLHLLAQPALGLCLEAAHVHHGIRGAEADGDAAFARSLCARRAIPFHLLRFAPDGHPPEGREAHWRRRRYELLADLRRRRDAAAIATGHHRDDVAEGVLVQLLRGAGPRALAGILDDDGWLVRPLLPYHRAQLEQWLRRKGLAWREDSSNRDLAHLRSRVRHQVLPALEALAPRLRDHLVHLAEALARDERHLARELAARAPFIDPWEPDGGVATERLATLSGALRVRWLHAQAARCGITGVSRRHGELLDRLLACGEPRAITLGGRWRLRRWSSRLWLEPPAASAPYALTIEPGTVRALPLPGWEVRLRDGSPSPDARWWLRVPAGEIVVRGAIPGEAAGARPLAERLQRRLPPHLRRAWPVVVADGTLAWVPGVWQAEGAIGAAGLLVEVARR